MGVTQCCRSPLWATPQGKALLAEGPQCRSSRGIEDPFTFLEKQLNPGSAADELGKSFNPSEPQFSHLLNGVAVVSHLGRLL